MLRFAQLFLHFAPLLKGFFIRAGVAPSAAEDIAQEAMLSVWHKASYFDPERASAGTWIFTIARNLRVDQKRKERGSPGEDLNAEIANPMPSDNLLSLERDTLIHAAGVFEPKPIVESATADAPAARLDPPPPPPVAA